MKSLLCLTLLGAALTILPWPGSAAFAQQTCQPATRSCSELTQECRRRCNNTLDAAECARTSCDTAQRQCLTSGRWQNQFACFTTQARR
jgi:hypothetical protein